MEKCKTILLVCLIVLMLAAAGVYIGGSQFARAGAADVRTLPPDGTVPVGTDAPATRTLADAGLLVPEAAAVRAGSTTVGAFAGDIPDTVTSLAFPLIHTALAADATLSDTTAQALADAAAGNFILLRLPGALPYQLLYALTGDIDKAAASDHAVSADVLLLAFDDDGTGRLFLSDGTACAVSDKPIPVRMGTLTALTGSEHLSAVTVADNLLPVGDVSVTIFPLTVEDGADHPLSADAGNALLSLFAFNPDRHRLSAQSVVEPHGSLTLSRARMTFAASRDGGIPIASFLEDGKDVRDIGIYDILTAAATFADRLRAINTANFGGAATPFLKGFYKDGDGYTVRFGLLYNGIELCGAALPDFLTLTVSGGMFTAVEVRRICAVREGTSLTLFPASWQYAAAAAHTDGGLRSLRLLYAIDTIPAACDAGWYCDRTPYDAEAVKAVQMNYAAYRSGTESGAAE